tara:strand:+ start:312 stop:497 length:186 start_codon:yes stop_codon:yes gene_type:complete
VFVIVELLNDFYLAFGDEKHVTAMSTLLEDETSFVVVVIEHIFFDGAIIILFEKIKDLELR